MLASHWRAWRPPAVDVLVAAGFVLLGQLVTWGRLEDPDQLEGPRMTNAVLSLLLMASLAWRRRAPLAALGWAVGLYFLPHAVVPHDMSFLAGALPLIVLTASAGYHCARPRAVLAAVLAVLAFVAVTLSTPALRSTDAFVINTGFLLVPWIGARGLRRRENRAAAFAAELATERASKDAALREAAAGERAHIARELHDIVAHSVSMMVIQIGGVRMQLPEGSSAAAPLLDAEEIGRQTLDDLRRLLGVLRAEQPAGAAGAQGGAAGGPEPPQPGLSQLDVLLTPTRATGLRVDVETVGCPVPLPAALDLTCYRIVQEALTNTVRHSGASRATVRLSYTPSTLHIDVVDDGTAAAADAGAGHGLIGVHERVGVFGGHVVAGPAPDGGWQVRAELPLPTVPGQRAPLVAAS